MNQEVLENEKTEISPSSGLIRWVVIVIVVIAIFGGSFWYYNSFIKPQPQPTPEPTFTEAVWKTKSEKTVNDFMGYWREARSGDSVQANKARDLLTNAAQANLQTLKDTSGAAIADTAKQLVALLALEAIYNDYQIAKTTKIDDNTVEVLVKFNYTNKSLGRIFTTKNEENFWLIDRVVEEKIEPSQSPSVSSSPIISPSPSQ